MIWCPVVVTVIVVVTDSDVPGGGDHESDTITSLPHKVSGQLPGCGCRN